MNIQFVLPDGLVLFMNSAIVPRHAETLELGGVNDPGFFHTNADYQKFDKTYRSVKWKVNSVHYKLNTENNFIAVIELTEKEESTSYSVN